MEHLNSFKIFENKLSKDEFIERYLDKRKIKFNNFGEIIYSGSVNLSGKNLEEVPVKFYSVENKIWVNNNKLKTFEFLPEIVIRPSGLAYEIENNDFKGSFEEIFNLLINPSYSIDDKVFNYFIQECLSYEVWSNGKTNERAVQEVWKQTKLHFFNESSEFLYENPELFDLNDEEVFFRTYSLEEENWVEKLIDNLIEDLKNKPNWALKLLHSIVNNKSHKDIIKYIEEKYDLSQLVNKSLSGMSDGEIRTFANMMYQRAKREESKISRDENYDLYVFLANYEFVENEDGSYSRKLIIWSLIKTDLYNQKDLERVEMMKFRSRFNPDTSVYMIWMPKGIFEENKSSYSPSEIPDYLLKLIDEKKTKL